MNDRDITLVRESWAHISSNTDAAMAAFYANLFELDENVAKLFADSDMSAQGVMLANALDLAIGGLDQQDGLSAQLQAIGARHADYGVSEPDFATVGKALLITLEAGLSGKWTKAHKTSWSAVYSFLSSQMLVGLLARQAA